MKTWVRKSLNVGVLSAGFILVGGTVGTSAAQAADMNSGPNAGALTGNQLSSVLQVPVDVCGNAVAVGGFADASCEGGASATNGGGSAENMTTGYNSGVASGNQVSSVIQVPISACGNAVSVLGFADASCTGGSSANNGGGSDNGSDDDGSGAGGYSSSYERARLERTSAAGSGSAMADGSGMTTGYNAGAVSGNQLSSVIQIPVDISGNAIALGGFASGSSTGGASATSC